MENNFSIAERQMGGLMELINPVVFAGLSNKSAKEHLSRYRSRIQDI